MMEMDGMDYALDSRQCDLDYGFYAIEESVDHSTNGYNDSKENYYPSRYHDVRYDVHIRGIGGPTTSHRDLSVLSQGYLDTPAVVVNLTESRPDNPMFQVLLQEDIDQRSQLKRGSSLMLDMESCFAEVDCEEITTPTYQTLRNMVDFDNQISNNFTTKKCTIPFSPRQNNESPCYSNRKRSRFG